MRHRLKTWPDVYQATEDGTKTFEFRKDDRGFEVGDALDLEEWEPSVIGKNGGGYTGRKASFRVTYILRGPSFGIPKGYVVMSIKKEAT